MQTHTVLGAKLLSYMSYATFPAAWPVCMLSVLVQPQVWTDEEPFCWGPQNPVNLSHWEYRQILQSDTCTALEALHVPVLVARSATQTLLRGVGETQTDWVADSLSLVAPASFHSQQTRSNTLI